MGQTQPHAFQTRKGSKNCATCGGWADASYHNMELWDNVDREREAVRQIEQAAQMSEQMRRGPLHDASIATGRIERDSPLFFGSGENPPLF